MAIHSNEMHFYREQQKIIADNRAREQQRTRDWEASRQRQREQKFWDEHAAYVKRVTTPPKMSKPEPPILVLGRAPVFVPDESQQDATSKDPARCFSASVEDFLARILGYAFTAMMWAYAGMVTMPWLYASAFNRALIGLGVGFGLSVNLAVWIICGIEFLVLCRVGKWIASGTATCMAAVLVLPVAMLEAGFDALFRKKSS
jgi:hypothetical protein